MEIWIAVIAFLILILYISTQFFGPLGICISPCLAYLLLSAVALLFKLLDNIRPNS